MKIKFKCIFELNQIKKKTNLTNQLISYDLYLIINLLAKFNIYISLFFVSLLVLSTATTKQKIELMFKLNNKN